MNQKIKNLAKILAHLGYSEEAAKVGFFVYAESGYVIQSGDNPWSLSNGDPQYQKAIMDANPNIDWTKLQIGQKIILPDKISYPNENMMPTNSIMSFIMEHEKFRSEQYDDGFGNITIGYGHVIKDGERFGAISEQKARQIMRVDLETAASFLRRNISQPLSPNQFDALTSLVYNAGGTAVYGTDLFKSIDSGDFQTAGVLFSNTLVGKNQQGVAIRRTQEAEIFKK